MVRPVTLAAVRDVTPGEQVGPAVDAGRRRVPWRDLGATLPARVIATANLQGAVTSRGVAAAKRTASACRRRSSPAPDAVGFDVLTLANNHSFVFGRSGSPTRWPLLRAAGIATVGAGPNEAAARRPVFIYVGGLRIASSLLGHQPAGLRSSPCVARHRPRGCRPILPPTSGRPRQRALLLVRLVPLWRRAARTSPTRASSRLPPPPPSAPRIRSSSARTRSCSAPLEPAPSAHLVTYTSATSSSHPRYLHRSWNRPSGHPLQARLLQLGTMATSGADSYDGGMLRRLRIENLVLIREAELELDEGLNAITGETGAGKTILSNAIGLLLGARGEAALIGAAADEAYVEAEFDLPDDEALGELAELRPEGEETLVLARRIFADGRTRAYAWGRSAAREDVAAAVEALLAMSGQFEQRRLARPGYQLARARRLRGARRHGARGAPRLARARPPRAAPTTSSRATPPRPRRGSTSCARSPPTPKGSSPAAEDELRAERERLRHVTELAHGAADGARGALRRTSARARTDLVAAAERAVAPLERLAPGARRGGRGAARGRALAARGRDPSCARFLDSLEAEPGRLEEVEGELDRHRRPAAPLPRPDLRRAARARGRGPRASSAALADGHDPARAAAEALAAAQAEVDRLHAELREARREAAPRVRRGGRRRSSPASGSARASSASSSRERRPGRRRAPTRSSFSVRPNAGLPFGPVAETASGGELSRIALAIAAVGGGETMVFDEIDAGIGGQTAHAVGETLRRLAARAQVVTITHLPQIASLADRHFRVEKVPGDPTHTRIEPLDARRAPRRARADARRRRLPRHARVARMSAGLARAARLAGRRLGVPRRAVPPLRLVARDRAASSPTAAASPPGARWRVSQRRPARSGSALPRPARAGRPVPSTLVIAEIEPLRALGVAARRRRGTAARAPRTSRSRCARRGDRDRTVVTIGVSGRRAATRADRGRPALRPRPDGRNALTS